MSFPVRHPCQRLWRELEPWHHRGIAQLLGKHDLCIISENFIDKFSPQLWIGPSMHQSLAAQAGKSAFLGDDMIGHEAGVNVGPDLTAVEWPYHHHLAALELGHDQRGIGED